MAETRFLSPILYNATETLQQVLQELGEQSGHKYVFESISWAEAWTGLVRASLYGREPDVAGIGSSWISDFVGMGSLRHFSPADIEKIGHPESFLKANWQSGVMNGQVWSIPWVADTRLLFYRRDILEKAGVDESRAFNTHEALIQTLQQLQAYGYPIPFVLPTQLTRMTLQHMASWVWEAGGDFLTDNHRRTLFSKPETLLGMERFFSLRAYLAPAARLLGETASDSLFTSGEAAVVLGGPWLTRDLQSGIWEGEARWGVHLPRIPFMGGTNLVIYRQAGDIPAAIHLIRYLTSRRAQEALLDVRGLLPTRQSVLMSSRTAGDPVYQSFSQGFQFGRSFPSFHLWGLVEDRLTRALAQVWQELFAHPDQPESAILAEIIPPLAQELDSELRSG